MPRDERTFITVHDGMPEHPKVEGLSDAAFRLMVEVWCWCSRNRTDGKVTAASWRKRGTARARAELLAARLIEETDDGVIVHDYTEHQRTAAEIDELKEKRRAAGSKGGRTAASARANGQASATAKPKQDGSKSVAETETETDRARHPSSSTAGRGTRLTPDWRPPAADAQWTLQRISRDEAELELEKFRNHWIAKTGKDATKLDWGRTWRNWVLGIRRPPGAPPLGERRPSTADQRVAQGLSLAEQLRREEAEQARQEITA